MFGIGMPEMLLLLAVALIVFGPKKLPELAKSLGRALGEFKRATSDLKETIETETGIGEVRDNFKDVAKEINTPGKLAGDVPDPTPADGAEPASAMEGEYAPYEGAVPLDKAKTAFDELNSGQNETEEFSSTGDSSPSKDQDPKSQDDPNP